MSVEIRACFAAAVVLLGAQCVFASPSADWAKSELERARAADAEAVSRIETERSAAEKRIADLAKEAAELELRLSNARKSVRDASALSEKSDFYDSMGGAVAADLRRFFNAELPAQSASLADAAESLEREVLKSFKELFSPLEFSKTSVSRVKTGEKLDGETFRVGGFRYFIGGGTAGMLTPDGVLYMESLAPQIRDFASGSSDSIPADVSGGAMLSSAVKNRTLAEDISLGGIWMYPILFFGALSAAVCAVKFASFFFIRRAPKNIVRKIFDELSAGRVSAAEKLAGECGYPYSGLLGELVKSRALSASLLEEISYERMLSAGERLFGGLSVLSVSAAVAPLFGLLGTVTGIIKTFSDLSALGAGQAQFVSAGISEALITTEYGLIVAIPAFVAHAILSRRAKGVLSDMEKLASSFLAANKS